MATKKTEAADEAVVEPQPDEAAADEAAEDQPVPELKHPSAAGYVLREGQWVVADEPAPETPEE